jgi:hypothetical protein
MSVLICIDGLPITLTSDDLQRLGGQYGRVLNAWSVKAPNGQSLGFGYLEVATEADAEVLIRMLNGSVHLGHRLNLALARGFAADRSKPQVRCHELLRKES